MEPIWPELLSCCMPTLSPAPESVGSIWAEAIPPRLRAIARTAGSIRFMPGTLHRTASVPARDHPGDGGAASDARTAGKKATTQRCGAVTNLKPAQDSIIAILRLFLRAHDHRKEM